jgi:hypothetical protein
MEYAGIARAETELFANHSMFLVQHLVGCNVCADDLRPPACTYKSAYSMS